MKSFPQSVGDGGCHHCAHVVCELEGVGKERAGESGGFLEVLGIDRSYERVLSVLKIFVECFRASNELLRGTLAPVCNALRLVFDGTTLCV